MDAVFYALGDRITVHPGTRILRASEYTNLLSANEIIDHARQQAEAMRKAAEEAYEEQKKQGYKDGMEEGQLQQSEKMLETSFQTISYLEGLETKIVDVVIQALRKIIGELDTKERIVRVVRTALDKVRSREHVEIHVCPEEEQYVRDAMAPMLSFSASSQSATKSMFEVVADPRMKPGDCVFQSEMGIMDASLDVQLKAIEQALTSRVGGGQGGL